MSGASSGTSESGGDDDNELSREQTAAADAATAGAGTRSSGEGSEGDDESEGGRRESSGTRRARGGFMLRQKRPSASNQGLSRPNQGCSSSKKKKASMGRGGTTALRVTPLPHGLFVNSERLPRRWSSLTRT